MSRESKIWLVVGGVGICLLLYLLGPILTPFLISALLAWLEIGRASCRERV